MLLLNAQTGNTTGTQAELECKGGNILLTASGTWDGATMTVEGSADGLPYQTLRDQAGAVIAITEDTMIVNTHCNNGLKIRGALSGVGAGTTVSLSALL